MNRYCFYEENEDKNEIREQAKIGIFKIFAERDQTEMSYFQFKIFIQTFFYLNKEQLDYQIIPKYGDECDYDIKLKKNITYDKIKEINILWKILFEVKEEIVLNKLINVIYQMTNVDESIIIQMIAKIHEDNQNLEIVKKCHKILKLFFIESEQNVVIDIMSEFILYYL